MSEVFMVDARSRSSSESLVRKLVRLMDRAGLPDMVGKGDRVAVKTHMGAPLTTRYLRPFYVRTVVEYLRGLGAEPTVVETTGLGLLDPRGTAEKYLRVAVSHGFTRETVDAEILIMDGEQGLDCVEVEVDGFRLRKVSVPRRLLEFDFMVGLAHFKGHEITGFGGAVKNYGVGCVCKETKYYIHFEDKPVVDENLCDGCGDCIEACPTDAITLHRGKARVDWSLCYGCKACQSVCPKKALKSTRHRDPREVQLRVVDAAYAVLKTLGFDKVFSLNFLIEVDWRCDCEHRQQGWSDLPIVPDIGILASTDPVAVDKASIDLVNEAPAIPGSQAYEVGAVEPGSDKFRLLYPDIDWEFMLKASEKMGLGSMAYRLVRVS